MQRRSLRYEFQRLRMLNNEIVACWPVLSKVPNEEYDVASQRSERPLS